MYKENIITKDVCSSYQLLYDSNNNHPKTQSPKTKYFPSHNSVTWPGFLLLHLVLPGVSACLQSPRNLTGLEHPGRLTYYMAASCWPLARRSSAEAVNWNTYTQSLHVDWASWLGGKVEKVAPQKKGERYKEPDESSKASFDLALDTTQCHFLLILLVKQLTGLAWFKWWRLDLASGWENCWVSSYSVCNSYNTNLLKGILNS